MSRTRLLEILYAAAIFIITYAVMGSNQVWTQTANPSRLQLRIRSTLVQRNARRAILKSQAEIKELTRERSSSTNRVVWQPGPDLRRCLPADLNHSLLAGADVRRAGMNRFHDCDTLVLNDPSPRNTLPDPRFDHALQITVLAVALGTGSGVPSPVAHRTPQTGPINRSHLMYQQGYRPRAPLATPLATAPPVGATATSLRAYAPGCAHSSSGSFPPAPPDWSSGPATGTWAGRKPK